jgi:biopolymer transport protein ExbD
MKFRKKFETAILECDLTPMIDVTFQLIAFFMLLLNFSEAERAEEIKLPTSSLAKPPEEPPDYQIILNLLPDGSIRFAGHPIDKIEFLTGTLSREISAAQREDVSPSEIAVIIRSHEDTPTGLVQELITKCQESELERFSLRVKEDVN